MGKARSVNAGAWIETPGRHLLPNAAARLLEAEAILVGRVSLGNLLYGAQASLATERWLAIFPGLFIFWIVLAVNLMGDGLSSRGRL